MLRHAVAISSELRGNQHVALDRCSIIAFAQRPGALRVVGEDLGRLGVVPGLAGAEGPGAYLDEALEHVHRLRQLVRVRAEAPGSQLRGEELERVHGPLLVFVKHAGDGRIFIADPALGNRILLEEDFAKTWNGLVFAVVGKPFREDSPLLQDNESLALKLRASALETGTAATPFVEYGLTKADLF